jgi:phosphoribosylamine--glycine ligase
LTNSVTEANLGGGKLKVLVVGSGAREHAIAWALSRSPRVGALYAAPGNGGTASLCTNLDGSSEDPEGLAGLAEAHAVDVTIIGPEQPLADGVVDLFESRGLKAFGPTGAAARIEASKSFARGLMATNGVPSPDFKVFDDYGRAKEFLSRHAGPVVVKADGLAAGKGVTVCRDSIQALEALSLCMESRSFGTAGERVVVEECMEGREVSVFAFTDGTHLSPMVSACDYKRLGDGDRGPNTGGMGSYTPPEVWSEDLEERVRVEIMEPVLGALRDAGSPYKGVLYAGLMLTETGPRVLEFNCRLGDPETQTLMPRMASDPLELMLACSEGNLDRIDVRWDERHYVGVVLASGGYPDKYDIGFEVSGLDAGDADTGASLVFTAGVAAGPSGGPVTAGGRVLSVVGGGDSIAEARAKAYARLNGIAFPGAHWRTDIGLSA